MLDPIVIIFTFSVFKPPQSTILNHIMFDRWHKLFPIVMNVTLSCHATFTAVGLVSGDCSLIVG